MTGAVTEMSTAPLKLQSNGSGLKLTSQTARSAAAKRVWIDLENSPHVPFFAPIVSELKQRGYDVLITARDGLQVAALADLMHLPCRIIGRHYGKKILLKYAGAMIRVTQLIPVLLRYKPDLALSHGSRTQVIAASMFNVPTLVLDDYEFAKDWVLIYPTWTLRPEVISADSMNHQGMQFATYPGIKEDVYVPSFRPRQGIREELGVASDELLVTIRPPATEAHYHVAESDLLFHAAVDFLAMHRNVKMVMLPRTVKQEEQIRRTWPQLFDSRKILVPKHVVDGLNLIWYSDLVISGGGTMNREAAALGVPVYSTFRGKIGGVDRYLAEQGRLALLTRPEDIPEKVRLVRRKATEEISKRPQIVLECVVDQICRVVEADATRN